MIAIPMDDKGFKVKRGIYWAWYLAAAVFYAITNQIPEYTNNPGTYGIDLMVTIGLITLTYGRLKDIGWHGLWALACLVPFFNIVIGFIRSAKDTTSTDPL